MRVQDFRGLWTSEKSIKFYMIIIFLLKKSVHNFIRFSVVLWYFKKVKNWSSWQILIFPYLLYECSYSLLLIFVEKIQTLHIKWDLLIFPLQWLFLLRKKILSELVFDFQSFDFSFNSCVLKEYQFLFWWSKDLQ